MKRTFLAVFLSLLSFAVFAKEMNVIEITNMRTQDIRSQVVQNWLNTTGKFPIVNNYDDGSQYYNYYNEGVTVLFVKHKLNVVFVYAEGIEDHRQFNGLMPYGLKMSMAKKEIDQILGKPDPNTKDGTTDYSKKYVGVKYDGTGSDARPNVIQFY